VICSGITVGISTNCAIFCNGWDLKRIAGSHHFFRRSGSRDVINLQPRGGQAKLYQVRQAREVLKASGLL
jgi:hypothetical protein